nr:GGDEF domain-containing response regulator [Oceanococcus sp. HetDA_MAG_MS8]
MIPHPRIALVEDSQADQVLFCKMLSRAVPNAQVEVFSSADAFKSALRPGSFDCVFLDHRLPDGTGLDVLHDLRCQDEFETLPAIMLTGWGNEATAVQAMKWGASDYLPKGQVDAKTLTSAMDAAFSAAARAERKRDNDRRLKEQIFTDDLTGVFNRRAFDEAIVALDQGQSRPALALAYLDLNEFKEVNDIHGHAAGDEVLRQIASRLQSRLRSSDSVYRLGGDEFVVVLSPPPRGQDLDALVSGLHQALKQPIRDADGKVLLQAGGSLGVAGRGEGGEPMTSLVERADRAMYRAKRNQGGRDIDCPELDCVNSHSGDGCTMRPKVENF